MFQRGSGNWVVACGGVGWGGERDFGRERESKGILGELMCCCWVAIRVRVRQRGREHKRERISEKERKG